MKAYKVVYRKDDGMGGPKISRYFNTLQAAQKFNESLMGRYGGVVYRRSKSKWVVEKYQYKV